MTNQDIMKIAIEQSKRDYGLEYSDFFSRSYLIKQPKKVSKEARNYLLKKPYCNFVYYGKTLVAIVDEKMKPFIERYLKKVEGEIYRAFDAPQITSLNNELEKHGKCIAHLAQFYLPDLDSKCSINKEVKVKLFYGDDILELYSDPRFPMALAYSRTDKRRDEIAIAGYMNDQIVGVAGATNDCKTMWQVGIDVIAEYRNQGIATTLVYKLSQEILKLGIVPFYCCAWSNIASKKVARRAGYIDGWVELTAKEIDEEWIKKIRN